MKELEMIKAFTELELKNEIPCHKSIEFDDIQCVYWVETVGFSSYPLIDAITDLALNCAARDKYRVENDFDDGACFIYDQHGGLNVEVDFNGNIARASIECILKSEGLWK